MSGSFTKKKSKEANNDPTLSIPGSISPKRLKALRFCLVICLWRVLEKDLFSMHAFVWRWEEKVPRWRKIVKGNRPMVFAILGEN